MPHLKSTTLAAAVLLGLAGAWLPAIAQDGDDARVVESESGAVERLLYRVWSSLKSLSPRTEDVRSRSVVATAGLRGAEGEQLDMEPYWKGGLADDQDLEREIEAYREAIEQGRQGNVEALQGFLDEYPQSDLVASIRFAEAVAEAAAGRRDAARRNLANLIEQYPDHPLTTDARLLLERLQG